MVKKKDRVEALPLIQEPGKRKSPEELKNSPAGRS